MVLQDPLLAMNPDADIAAHRLDFQQTMPHTNWINPIYYLITEQAHSDYELFLSVANIIGLVKRYTTIRKGPIPRNKLEIILLT